MPPKSKRNCSKKLKVPEGKAKKGKGMDEKENKCYSSELSSIKSQKAPDKLPLEEKKAAPAEQNEFVSPPQTPKLKPTGFWSKKLQDLEENKTKKACGLYDFSGTDESDSSFKIKKKRKQNARPKKLKQVVAKYKRPTGRGNNEDKITQTHKLALVKEQIMLSKEKKKLDNQNQSFTFSTSIQTLGITSTPAVKKGNLIGASNFLFLSPIIKEEPEHCNSVMMSTPVELKIKNGSPLTQRLNKDNLRVETKLKQISCKRVLRNGKTLGT